MFDFKLFWKCLFSPALYAIHRGNHLGKYDPNDWERWGDNLINSAYFLWNLGVFSSPFLILMMSRKGYFSLEGVISLMKFSIGLTVVVGASYCIRSYGRVYNLKYRTFVTSLERLDRNLSDSAKREIKNYDFEFSAWPVEYECNGTQGEQTRRDKSGSSVAKRSWSKLVQSPCSIFSYLVLHSFGIRLIYPGSIRVFSFLLGATLVQGRSKLVEQERGERFKVKTEDGNYIDTMFVDKRGNHKNGTTLVICSEGNAGFYEYGIMVTPLEPGYSVLGWNHPGFAGSSGMPYPEQEQNAMNAVIEFAMNKLNFRLDQIVLFGWSIGGYTSTWAAMMYPEVKAVILDATFDDLLPLAIPRMPPSLEPIVKITIRQYANLDIGRQLVHYPGPVLLIRRSEDEVICLEPSVLSTNRGNNLLIKLLRHRFPFIIDATSENALEDWLGATGSHQMAVYNSFGVNDTLCTQLMQDYVQVNGFTFPMNVGQDMDQDLKIKLALYLASKYMEDFHSTHCTPLPGRVFRIPTPQSQI